MQEITGNLWDFHNSGNWVVITTNGTLNNQGQLVMGRGIALEAKIRYPNLPKRVAYHLKVSGNTVYADAEYRIFTFPVKHNWWEKADLDLIEKSTQQLVEKLDNWFWTDVKTVYLTRPGCYNGRRDWESEVKPILLKYMDDRFYIVNQ